MCWNLFFPLLNLSSIQDTLCVYCDTTWKKPKQSVIWPWKSGHGFRGPSVHWRGVLGKQYELEWHRSCWTWSGSQVPSKQTMQLRETPFSADTRGIIWKAVGWSLHNVAQIKGLTPPDSSCPFVHRSPCCSTLLQRSEPWLRLSSSRATPTELGRAPARVPRARTGTSAAWASAPGLRAKTEMMFAREFYGLSNIGGALRPAGITRILVEEETTVPLR